MSAPDLEAEEAYNKAIMDRIGSVDYRARARRLRRLGLYLIWAPVVCAGIVLVVTWNWTATFVVFGSGIFSIMASYAADRAAERAERRAVD